MANTIWFVSHRYAAPPTNDFVGNLCLWNRNGNHHRKLIEWHGATVIDSNNAAHIEQDINFIGEWECSSNFMHNGGKGLFNRTHTPNYTQHDRSIVCMNTDPYVFGRKFYWSCCHHPTDSRRVRRGDIVLFGSYTLVDRKVDKMVLDRLAPGRPPEVRILCV